MSYPQIIHKLPIVSFLDSICETLKASKSRFLVLTAETAAGKSTALPVALLQHFEGNILMLEPRRLATVAIANRVSEILGEEVGKTVGYTLHLESKKSHETRLEVVTEAILTRKLQSDPLLEDINVVVLDEFHERSIHADLALAFLKETMELRDDLYVIVMSATIDYKALKEYLNAEVMQIPGRQFPVEIEYKTESVENCIYSLLTNKQSLVYPQSTHNFVDNSVRNDTILAFLPGIYDIQKTNQKLEEKLSTNLANDVEILILHSSIPLSEQKKILSPVSLNSPRRIILSSAIAETSLTVPGVTTVVDSGLCRISKMNVALGMTTLVTEKESMFSANQRSGRAGRIVEGKCIRLWDKSDVRLESTPPEITRTDLSQLVLECSKWGTSDISKIDWLTPPSKASWNAAKELLKNLGCLDKNDTITKKGEVVLKLGLPLRLSCVALCGENAIPIVLKYSEYKDSSPQRQKTFSDDLRKRLQRVFSESKNLILDDKTFNPTIALLQGFPDRIAKRIEVTKDSTIYQFPSGRKAELKLTNGSEWILAPEVDAGTVTGKIYEYESLDCESLNQDFIEQWLSERTETRIVTTFSDSQSLKMQKSEITSYGEIVLKEKKLNPTPEDFSSAVCETVKRKGLNWLLEISSKEKNNKQESIEDFLTRVKFYSLHKESPISKKLENLSETVEEWLKPFLNGTNLNESTIKNALHWYLDADEIDREVPVELKLPNGRKRKIIYEKHSETDIKPVLEIIIQQIFGCFETPKIMNIPVLLHLLSPARRPLQITDDLEHFWNGAWIEICKEMKGRYPKHNWDYKIAEPEN